MKTRGLAILGGIGVGLSMLFAAWAAFQTFLQPAPGFPVFPWDNRWAAGYAALFLLAGGLALFKMERLLLAGLAAAAAGLFFTPLILADLALPLLTWVFLVYIFAGSGAFCLQHILPRLGMPLLDRWVISLVLGMGLWEVFTFVLGALQLYYQPLAYLILGAIGIIVWRAWWTILAGPGAAKIRQKWLERNPVDERRAALGLAVILILTAGSFIWALSPAIRYDSLSYHLAAPAAYVRAHGIVDIPEASNTYWVHFAEMLYTLGLLLAGQPLPGLLHFTACLASGGLVFILGRLLFGSRPAWFAALIFFSIPIVNIESGTAYIELFLTLALLSALYCGLRWQTDRGGQWLGLSGFCAGLAVGSKVSMLPLMLPFGILLVWELVRKRKSWAEALQGLLFFGIPFAMLASVFLVRDWLWTGNPVFPLFNSFFRSSKWVSQPTATAFSKTTAFSWLDAIMLPVTLTARPQAYYHETHGAILAGVPLLALPWVYWKSSGLRHPLQIILLWIASLMGAVLVFLSAANIRYLIPLYSVWSVLAGLNVQSALKIFSSRKTIQAIAGFLLVGGYLFSTRLAYLTNMPQLAGRFPLEVVFGQQSQARYLSEHILAYEALQYLDQIEPAPRVFSVGNEFRLYTRARIEGIIFSPQLASMLLATNGEDDLAASLKAAQFDYILVNEQERHWSPLYDLVPVVTNDFLLRYGQLVFSHNQVNVYRLREQPIRLDSLPANLLENPSFEALDQTGGPQGWSVAGNPAVLVDTSGRLAHSGQAGLLLNGPETGANYSFLMQNVPVTPGNIYTTAYWVRPDPVSANYLDAQVRWLDAQGQFIGAEGLWLAIAEPQWKQYRIHVTAPAGAVTAQVVAAVSGSQVAWLDDVCFAAGEGCP